MDTSPALVFSWMNFVAKSVHRVFHDAEIRSKFLVLHQNSGALSLSSKMVGFLWFSMVFYGFLSFSGDPTLKSLPFPGFPGPALENPSGFTRRVPPAGTCCWKSTADTAPTTRWSPRRPRLGEWRWGWHETIGWMETVWTCYFKQQKWWFNSEKYTIMMKHGDLIVSDIYSM